MDSEDRPRASPAHVAVAALVAGIVVVVLQFPSSGIDTDPPTCFGILHLWTVPCGGWATLVAGAVTALLAWIALLVVENPTLG